MDITDALRQVSQTFENKNITWAIFGGLGAAIYGGGRAPRDIDLIVSKYDEMKVNEILREFGAKELHNANNTIYSGMFSRFKLQDKNIDVCYESRVLINGIEYPFPVDELLFSNSRKLVYAGINVRVLSPEDIILHKALSQRTIKEGKYDIEDIRDIIKNQKINFGYLKERAEKCNAKNRVLALLNNINN